MQFRGGTYISQTTATNLNQAIELWANTLEVEGIQYLSQKTKKQLIDDLPELITDNEFVTIDTVTNIWIGLYRFKTGLATIHIFKTDTTPELV